MPLLYAPDEHEPGLQPAKNLDSRLRGDDSPKISSIELLMKGTESLCKKSLKTLRDFSFRIGL
jgi:hypothetical protein